MLHRFGPVATVVIWVEIHFKSAGCQLALNLSEMNLNPLIYLNVQSRCGVRYLDVSGLSSLVCSALRAAVPRQLHLILHLLPFAPY